MPVVLADIGGTHARFASLEGGAIVNPVKLAAADFPDIESALKKYVKKPCALMIATAAQPNGSGAWRFTNDNRWSIDPVKLRRAGWDVRTLLNDFEASAHGILSLPQGELMILRRGTPDENAPRAIIGPGTGLGLSYALALPRGGWQVQQTMGGHMAAAAITEEQREILQLLYHEYGDGRAIVYEDAVSGRALPFLYRAVCRRNKAPCVFRTAEDILSSANEEDARQTLRLFHEFLGLFAHNALVTLNAFGGLYIDGGVAQRLYESGQFDFKSFARFMTPDITGVVKKRLEATPVYMVNDPFIALRGLAEMAKNAA